MVKIVFPDHLLQHSAGIREIEVAADNFREVLLALDERWPGIEEILAKCAVAIDGHIYQDAYLEPLQGNSEIFFMQRIEGG